MLAEHKTDLQLMLRPGDSGGAVMELQSALAAAGYDLPGRPDGRFGPLTEAALAHFQARSGLVPDGVAGPRTLAALAGSGTRLRLPTVSDVTTMFPDTPATSIARHLPSILEALLQAGLGEPRLMLAALATIRAEVECFQPIEEAKGEWNTSASGHAFDLYDNREALGNRGAPDGADFRGRGYIQLTGRANYTAYAAAAGVPLLVAEPRRACDPDVAARLLAAFVASRRTEIMVALERNDLARARCLVNGGTHGLRRFTDAYRSGERLLGLV